MGFFRIIFLCQADRLKSEGFHFVRLTKWKLGFSLCQADKLKFRLPELILTWRLMRNHEGMGRDGGGVKIVILSGWQNENLGFWFCQADKLKFSLSELIWTWRMMRKHEGMGRDRGGGYNSNFVRLTKWKSRFLILSGWQTEIQLARINFNLKADETVLGRLEGTGGG